MKKVLILVPIVAMLAACGTTDVYQKRADNERVYKERQVERAIDQAPKWMTQVPLSNSAVYASGTSASGDYSMAMTKAKADAYSKICMAAGGTVSQRTKIYKSDTADASSELSEMVLRTSCKEVDITGVETVEKKIVSEGNRFRAYVLVALPTGDANILKKAKDQKRLNEIAAERAPEAFKELDDTDKPAGKPVSLNLMPVDNAEYKARRDAALQKPGAVIGQVSVQ